MFKVRVPRKPYFYYNFFLSCHDIHSERRESRRSWLRKYVMLEMLNLRQSGQVYFTNFLHLMYIETSAWVTKSIKLIKQQNQQENK